MIRRQRRATRTYTRFPYATLFRSPGLNDGAAFIMLGGRSVAVRLGATAQAEIVSSVRVAEGPTEGARTPAIAIHKLLSRQGMHVDQIDAIEKIGRASCRERVCQYV